MYHLKRVIEDDSLTFEEMSTLFATIEACMNFSRLAALTDNPDDLQAITSSHFVIGRSMTALAEDSTLDLKSQGLPRWRMLNQLRDNFGTIGKLIIYMNFKPYTSGINHHLISKKGFWFLLIRKLHHQLNGHR